MSVPFRSSAARLETAARLFPLGGVGRPEHVATLLAWLVGPANGFLTGQVVYVDGGHDALVRGDAVV
jgi:NAD(P)-dependent dehydrogenase (short-subunit alcohol dehydrogenase family)